MPVPMRFIPLLLSAFLWGMPMAADAQDEVFPRLPASAAKSQQEYEKALKDSAFEARAKFIADLKTLLKDSTKSEKLDDAVALRDAIRILESQNRIPLKLPMVFERDDKNMPALILTDRGYRWTDWKQGENARFEFSQTGGIVCYHPRFEPKLAGKFWGHLVISLDGKSALFWAPGDTIVSLKAKSR